MTTEASVTPEPGTQTIVVQVTPAPANPENIDRYIDISITFLGIIIVLALYKQVERIFSTQDTYS